MNHRFSPIKQVLLIIPLITLVTLYSGMSVYAQGPVTPAIAPDAQPITGEAIPQPSQKPFDDIDVGSSYYVQLKYLKDFNLINGYEDGTFRPKNMINRAEAAIAMNKILLNFEIPTGFKNKKEIAYTDIPSKYWAEESIQKLTTLGIVKGYTETEGGKDTGKITFQPEKTINLAEAVKMAMSIEMIKDQNLTLPTAMKSSFKDVQGTEWFAPYIELAQQKTLLTYSTKQLIHPNDNMTRGEFMNILYKTIKTREPGHFFGRGSFYSDFFEGRSTSNDEKYTQNGYTAAHLTLPFGTKLEVTYLRNGQKVTVRVNDRGPHTPSFSLDLTRKAFEELANPSEGIIPIEYRIVTE